LICVVALVCQSGPALAIVVVTGAGLAAARWAASRAARALAALALALAAAALALAAELATAGACDRARRDA
jgi:hypothetical protein